MKHIIGTCTSASVVCLINATAAASTIYVSVQNIGVRAIDVDSQTFTDVASEGDFNIAIGPNGTYFASERGTGAVSVIDISTGVATPTGVSIGAADSFGEGGDGFWYHNDGDDSPNLLRVEFSSSSNLPTPVGTGASGYVGDLATDPLTGITWGATTAGLVQVDRATGQQTVVAATQFSGTGYSGLAFTGDGRMWATTGGGQVFWIDHMDLDGDDEIGEILTAFEVPFGIADAASEVVPAPGAGLVFAGAGVLGLRRKRD